ncbi:MAG: hypothetical protein M3N43_07830 [Actinomycetota bacterium]|nr:hypothetical protein [Actinomycetota bacterium]
MTHPDDIRHERRANIRLAIVCAAVLAAGGGFWYAATSDSAAVAACKDAITRQVDTPSTIEWVSDRETEQAGETVVGGEYDSQNLNGAVVRSIYRCTVDPNGKVTSAYP